MEILVVDDDMQYKKLIKANVKGWGHGVKTSDTGKEALRIARQKKFDLVLLDIFLPDCEGHELIPQFKEMWPDIGIVTMTGYNTRELEWKVRQQGILYYLLKPFTMKPLKELLDHIAKNKRFHGTRGNGRSKGPWPIGPGFESPQ